MKITISLQIQSLNDYNEVSDVQAKRHYESLLAARASHEKMSSAALEYTKDQFLSMHGKIDEIYLMIKSLKDLPSLYNSIVGGFK